MIGMLMLVVIIPTVCLLWFASEAVRNERMAVRQRLTELYQSQLESLPLELQTFWEKKINKLSAIDPGMSPAERFNKIIGSGLSDSVILYDSKGELLYPCEVEPPDIDADFIEAETFEFRKKDYLAAAELYADIAGKSEDINIKVRARQRQVRNLIKAGKIDAAVSIAVGLWSNQEYNEARDNKGRLIVPDSELFILQSLEKSSLVFQNVFENLVSRVKDYSPPVMPSSQRLFLMEELKVIDINIEFSTFNAEEVASSSDLLNPGHNRFTNVSGDGLWQIVSPDGRIAQANLSTLDPEILVTLSSKLHVLQPGQSKFTKLPEEKGLWQIVSSDRSTIAFFNQDRIVRESQAFIESNISHLDADFLFVQKDVSNNSKPLLRMAAGDYFPEWELIVQVKDDDLFMTASEKQISLYLWTALLIIVAIVILTIITTRLFMRQMNLSRMKNDLLTTVSHELKTPLTSILLLADTLADKRQKDEALKKEYSELIVSEAERLTTLVENFLTFSRLEDKRQTFNFMIVEPEKIINSVYGSIKHRFESGGFSLDIKVYEKMPTIFADQDAISIVLFNLLDNACQYSDKIKSVTLEAYPENGNVCFKVEDKGIGMSMEAKKKILKPFYQVDQTLSRKGSGFGLGLSIVKSIVDVHKGSIEVESEPGLGSTFIIKIPEKD